jgi:hypothetical protein
MAWPGPVSLDHYGVLLTPLALSHASDLADALADGDLHRLS